MDLCHGAHEKEAVDRGVPFLAGITDGGRAFYYTEAELLDWKTRFQEYPTS